METITFSPEFFAGNRQRLRELFSGTAPIVITANGVLQKSADTTYPFTQDKNFWYFTGCMVPDALLVMDREKEYIILPERSDYQDIFDGAIDTGIIATTSGVAQVLSHKDGWRQLGGRIKKVKHIATISPAPRYLEVYGMYTNPTRALLINAIKEEDPAIEVLDIRDHCARLRAVKQPVEIAAIRSAIAITEKALKDITRPVKLAKYEYEYEIEADLTRLFRRSNTLHAFDPIIASGVRACTLHVTDLAGKLSSDELVQFDIGAEYLGYAADISRSYALAEPSHRQSMIHAAVLEVQEYALSLLKPGILLRDYEQQVTHFMGEKLRELNLIKTIEDDEVRTFYPHAASHFLGLDVHDVGAYDRPLEPGMVLTCEPGIYVADEAIGIRIEDDVLITETGNEVLTSGLPRSL